jgi:methylenetetrahydrofolate reductase (NADPH)
MITASGATDEITHGMVPAVTMDHEGGKGEVNAAASWDDFPNGRFGDFKSPAYGELNQWGSSTLSVSLWTQYDEQMFTCLYSL